jgi:hypothetical protein
MSDWKPLAAKLAALGLPFLGNALLGQIPVVGGIVNAMGGGKKVGEFAARMVADLLGVPPTPEAISQAIDEGNTTQVLATLKAAEGQVKDTVGAARDVAVSDNAIAPAIAAVNAESTYRLTELATRTASNDYKATFYRTIVVWGAGLALVLDLTGMSWAFASDIFRGTQILKGLEGAELMINIKIGLETLCLGWHWQTRDSLRGKAITAASQAAQANATTAAAAATAS